jgi:predicted Zn-ribbon and HTH transcriptional regulator
MTKLRIELPIYHCCRCGYNWKARKLDIPTQCPQCRSPYWNIAPEGFEKKRGNEKLSIAKSQS